MNNDTKILLSMFELANDDASVITLGQLREFINNHIENLPDSTPIMLNAIPDDQKAVVPCVQVLADEESIEFYNF